MFVLGSSLEMSSTLFGLIYLCNLTIDVVSGNIEVCTLSVLSAILGSMGRCRTFVLKVESVFDINWSDLASYQG